MTKRKTNAQEPAADIEEAVGQDQSPAGAEQEAAALVEGDGGGAAGADGSQQPAEPVPAGGTADGVTTDPVADGIDDQEDSEEASDDLGDGSGLGAGISDSEIPYGTHTDAPRSVVPDGARAQDGGLHGADAGGLGGDGDGVGSSRDDAALSDEGSGSAADAGGDGSALTDDPPAPYFRAADHHAKNEAVARGVASMIFDQVLRIMGNGEHPAWAVAEAYGELVALTEAQASVAATLLREIGWERAKVSVVETQLSIKGLIARPLLMPEQIALDAFLFAVASLDGAAAGLEAHIAAAMAEANAKPVPPVPIDETTLEPVDDVNATWG